MVWGLGFGAQSCGWSVEVSLVEDTGVLRGFCHLHFCFGLSTPTPNLHNSEGLNPTMSSEVLFANQSRGGCDQIHGRCPWAGMKSLQMARHARLRLKD